MGCACTPMCWWWLAAGAWPQHLVQKCRWTAQRGAVGKAEPQQAAGCSFLVCRQETCTSKEQYWMCPLCKTCPYWQLSKICSTFMVRSWRAARGQSGDRHLNVSPCQPSLPLLLAPAALVLPLPPIFSHLPPWQRLPGGPFYLPSPPAPWLGDTKDPALAMAAVQRATPTALLGLLPIPQPHSVHRQDGSLTTVGTSSSASSCPCGQCCSWSSRSGPAYPWLTTGTAPSSRTQRWDLALCSASQYHRDQSHQAPLMPFPLFPRSGCGPSSQPWLP